MTLINFMKEETQYFFFSFFCKHSTIFKTLKSLEIEKKNANKYNSSAMGKFGAPKIDEDALKAARK